MRNTLILLLFLLLSFLFSQSGLSGEITIHIHNDKPDYGSKAEISTTCSISEPSSTIFMARPIHGLDNICIDGEWQWQASDSYAKANKLIINTKFNTKDMLNDPFNKMSLYNSDHTTCEADLLYNAKDLMSESVEGYAVTAIDTGTNSCDFGDEFKVLASDGAGSDRFGYSVAISGDYAIIGARYDDDNGSDSGSAYIFKRNGNTWSQMSKLTASDGASSDYFGYSVSISGDYAIVGALLDDDNGSDSGSAYIFKRNGSTWSQMTKLTASDGAIADYFGNSVSISGNYAIIGAHLDDDNGAASGSAYIFQRNDTIWSQMTKLTASDGSSSDYFGYSVSISGDYALIGAYLDDDKGSDSGSAYVFKRSGTTWSQMTKLTASDGASGDFLGNSVSLTEDHAIVGAHFDDDNGNSSGSAYVFERNDTIWSQMTKLTASDGANVDYFGYSVSVSGNYIIVGALFDDDSGTSSGSAYVFERNGTTWSQMTKLTASDGVAYDYFGISVAIFGDYAIVGAYGDDDNGSTSGSAYFKACYNLSSPLSCTSLSYPLSESNDIPVDTALHWQSDSLAAGYVLLVGTCSGCGDILDSLDVGDTTTYNPGLLPYGDTIFITIIPYDSSGSAAGCQEEWFVTEHLLGCMDPSAHNFDSLATVDDGSCETCSDGLQNGDETDVDCGGSLCSPCQFPEACLLDRILWVDYLNARIKSANKDGLNITYHLEVLDYPKGISLDIMSGKVYWVDAGTDKIQRANLDGSNVEDLVTNGLSSPWGITLDLGEGKMYWTDLGTDKIQRANLDGSNIEDLVTNGLSNPGGITLDLGGGKMYWTDLVSSKIQRANLDGSNIEDLISSGLVIPYGIEIDTSSGKMYWTDLGTDKIQRANLDGSNIEDLVTTGLIFPQEISLNIIEGKMYWTDRGTGKIQRANLDGSNIEDLISSGLSQIEGISLDIIADKMYWTDSGTDKIQRSNFDGSNIEDIVHSYALGGIDIDVYNKKIYWTDWGTDKIQRSNFDGSNIEDLVITGLDRPHGIALDVSVGKMYWTDWGTQKIQRANLDGSNIEDLISSGLSFPQDIALDVSEEKMYWTDRGTRKIQRANLNGSGVEDLVTSGLNQNQDITLDVSVGKMYWTDWGTQKIQRANLDGTNIEDIITTGLTFPQGIALDTNGGKIYWTDRESDKIQRANFDGTNIEDLINTGLFSPRDIIFFKQIPNDLCTTVYNSDMTQAFNLQHTINCASSSDTVYFASCIHGDTIQGPISIDEDVTILSHKMDSIYIRGSDTEPAFIIEAGHTVNLEGLHIIAQSEIPYLLIENEGMLTIKACEMYPGGSTNEELLIDNSGQGETDIIGESNVRSQ